MIQFFKRGHTLFAVESDGPLSSSELSKLTWLFGGAQVLDDALIKGEYIGPRATMITPWSTNAVEICSNMGLNSISRIEHFIEKKAAENFDPMLMREYQTLDGQIFSVVHDKKPVRFIDDIAAYNQEEGLALSEEEVDYLSDLAARLGRYLTDSEVFGFSQVNSEHCRHKIFNGTFIIDGVEQDKSLFQMIKETSKENPNAIVSAYKDNVAFIEGPALEQFAPARSDEPSNYHTSKYESVLSLKAETHNFPTTVEPFNGAATGSGGEIRDRMAGGQGSIPLAGTAVYMTAYSRMGEDHPWEKHIQPRNWLYQHPSEILIKASNGASDFGNKFGQPLICGSLLTFEHEEENGPTLGFDKVIMLAGGIGVGKKTQALKGKPEVGDKIVVMGGDNYRIGMGGAAVSSADTGEYGSGIELNAVQRSNPEMQKRVANAIRAFVEQSENPIVSIHDHGAGGHLNCLSELVEEVGGRIYMKALPVGDPTLSAREIIGNESQERMGLIIKPKDLDLLIRTAERERAPIYVVGEVTGDHRFTFVSGDEEINPIDLELVDFFGNSPKTVLHDQRKINTWSDANYSSVEIHEHLRKVLRMESVASKDWLVNKVDRCVGGLVAKQQCCGELQLPLNNCGVMSLDFSSQQGVATAMGHAPTAALIDPAAGSRLAIAEALTNILSVPLKDGLSSVSLSANWMWPCKNAGEDARLYDAVNACARFAKALGINIPTGKDSLSMAQKYPDKTVLAPGTVIITAAGHCDDITKIVEPVLQAEGGNIYYLDLSGAPLRLGGSVFFQTMNKVGSACPDVSDPMVFRKAFDGLQSLIHRGEIQSLHDVSSGGLITALLEMCFPTVGMGAKVDLGTLEALDVVHMLFAENPGVLFQTSTENVEYLQAQGLDVKLLGKPIPNGQLNLTYTDGEISLDVADFRKVWSETSYRFDGRQTANDLAKVRFENLATQPLRYVFPETIAVPDIQINKGAKPKAAVIREKGSNSEREMANAMFRAGFDVLDVHMTDLITGKENLENVQFLGAVGGFSNSDVLGSAKGWAGAFNYNENARNALMRFFSRQDTLSVGICNGCQLFIELGLLHPELPEKPKMLHNDSGKHESIFTSVEVLKNNSVMLSSMEGLRLGIWVSHGEGKFYLPGQESDYRIVAKYGYSEYPANPNGSDYNTAMLTNEDGRHLVTMPHFERSLYPWNWAHYPKGRTDEFSPWIEAFVNAAAWLK